VQIVALFRQGMTPEQIASGLDWSLEAVKTVLAGELSGSTKVNGMITDEEHKLIIDALKEVAVYEQENVGAKVKAGIYLNEEKMGRNDARVRESRIPKMDIGKLNIIIVNARKKIEAITGKPTVKDTQLIEV
jgi:hypothetical protein